MAKLAKSADKTKKAVAGKAAARDDRKKVKTSLREKIGSKEYASELQRLHVELVTLQQWAIATGAKVCVLFEGRDTAGKGGTIKATDTSWAPWYVADTDDKKRGRLNIITHFLGLIPYHSVPRSKIQLPKRQKAKGYRAPNYTFKRVPEKFWQQD
jgi:polyphosphate kinase 2 (PPK2 family)